MSLTYSESCGSREATSAGRCVASCGIATGRLTGLIWAVRAES